MRKDITCPNRDEERCAFPIACPRFNVCRRYRENFRVEMGEEMATDSQHCGDQGKHGPHTWYSPSSQKGSTTQDTHNCPGTR